MSNIVINGTGISGLVSALILVEKGRGRDVVLVDKSSEPGGLLRRFRYAEFGDFDYGMHNFLETGIPELDRLVFELLPESEWQLLTGERRDLAGVYANGVLQKNTPYLDLRNLQPQVHGACLVDFCANLDQSGAADDRLPANAAEYLCQRFGKVVAQHTYIPALQKIHRMPADRLDTMATIFTPMDRVALCNENLIGTLTESAVLRRLLAWSDQRTLPLERSSGRRAYYPRQYGVYRVVDAIVQRLERAGAQILTNSSVTALQRHNQTGAIAGLSINTPNGSRQIEDPELLVWTGNIPALARLLGVTSSGVKPDKPLKTIIVNLLLDREPDVGDLYYFFCYEPGYWTFRFTNYINYCSGAMRNGGFPVCLELLIDEESLAQIPDIVAVAQEELNRFGILRPGTRILFARAEVLESGFPMPSITNISALKEMRDTIRTLGLQNLYLTGILAEDKLFFQTDVLIDVYRKLNDRI